MTERDDKLLPRYRSIERETPPPALDAAILAASRRSVRAPTVPRWAAPVSVAAVLVLALGLVLKVQREAPDAGMPVETQAAPSAPSPVDSSPPDRRQDARPAAPRAEAPAAQAEPKPARTPLRQPKVEAKRFAPADPGAAL